jgi:hypothetical protein
MTKYIKIIFAACIVLAAAMAGCNKDKDPEQPKDVTINIAAISGITAPVAGATPTATVPATEQYTAAITWQPAAAAFAHSTAYTATVTLTAKAGYTLAGVAANFFTVAGATATSEAGKGVVTAVFPETAAAPAIAVTAEGLDNLKVGVAVTASILYTLANGEYAASITAADFAVSDLPAGLSGAATRTSGTAVTVAISGTPTTANATETTITLPASIPAANVAGATSAVTPAGTVTAGAVAKGNGAEVNYPTAKNITRNSIEITVTIIGTNPGGQTVEYAIREVPFLPESGWQSDTLFEGLEADTYYWLFARTAENANCYAGTTVRSAQSVSTNP